MNYYKLIQLIKIRPELWDRCNASFREPQIKEETWNDIAKEMEETTTACKDGFKHLREKYLREREKSKILKDKYHPWEFLQHLTFLDGQIIPRKCHSLPFIQHKNQDNVSDRNSHGFSQFFSHDNEDRSSNSKFALEQTTRNFSQFEFDKLLVELVKNTRPLWDWKNGKFWNKQIRSQTWDMIAQQLNKTPTECFIRWKALREKYIREKMKHRENKWELLDSMSFLDNVIQHRKSSKNSIQTTDSNFQDSFADNQNIDEAFNNTDFLFSGESSTSNHEYHYKVMTEENSFCEPMNEFSISIKTENEEVPDSSYDSPDYKKRRGSTPPSCCYEKRQKVNKTTEDIFGELVVSLLSKKSEAERYTAMVEIMRVLGK